MEKLGCTNKISCLLQKLVLIEEGGQYKPNKTEISSKNEFGTLIIQLPSVYSGGELVVSIDDTKNTFDFGLSKCISEFECTYAAMYSEIEWELLRTKSGKLLLLVYSIIWKSLNDNCILLNRDASDSLNRILKQIHKPDTKIAIELENSYSESTFDKRVLHDVLNGNDLKIYQYLKEMNLCLDENYKYVFSIAISTAFTYSFRESARENRSSASQASNTVSVNRSKITRPIHKWYDADGCEIFTENRGSLSFFTKIISIDKEFVDNLDEESAWTRNHQPNYTNRYY